MVRPTEHLRYVLDLNGSKPLSVAAGSGPMNDRSASNNTDEPAKVWFAVRRCSLVWLTILVLVLTRRGTAAGPQQQ